LKASFLRAFHGSEKRFFYFPAMAIAVGHWSSARTGLGYRKKNSGWLRQYQGRQNAPPPGPNPVHKGVSTNDILREFTFRRKGRRKKKKTKNNNKNKKIFSRLPLRSRTNKTHPPVPAVAQTIFSLSRQRWKKDGKRKSPDERAGSSSNIVQ